MRVIKFRVWNKDCEEMIFLRELLLINKLNKVLMTEDSTYIIMQFTGLNDKNGKEIYEGDIINGRYGTLKVSWDKFDAGFFPFHMTINATDGSECEVIGNIYENKEMIK